MKVFLSWSGYRSKKVAELFKEWLPCVINEIEPWISTEDINKGKMWPVEIAKQLEGAKFGISCLTKENLTKPWLLFEAGALSKTLTDSYVCTFLLDIENSEIEKANPLHLFESTKNSKEDVFKLLETINKASEKEILDSKLLNKSFEKWWPDFEKEILSIKESKEEKKSLPERTERELLAEILETVRNMERVFGTKKVWVSDPSGNLIDASGNTATWVRSKVVHSYPPLDDGLPQQESQVRRKEITVEDMQRVAEKVKKKQF